MSTQIASKNLYELLGNDHDEDSDKEPEPPVKVIDKTPARTTKRNAPAEAPAAKAPSASDSRGPRRGQQGSEGAFRDRQAGSANNRGKPTGEAGQQDRAPRNERAQGTYGGRGNRGVNRNYDRHSRGVGGESEKQANHGWGATEGDAELKDEEAGEALAKADQKEALTGDGDGAAEAAAEPEPEDNSKSYADYERELAEKKASLNLGAREARKPDAKQDKKWANAKAISKDEEEDFVAGSSGKTKRERERKQKQVVDIDQRFVEQTEQRGGGRGGFRGSRGRGEGGPPRGDRPERGGGRGGRGGDRGRGGRGDGPSRGGPRGGGHPRNNGGGPGANLNTEDKSAFPSLGGK